MPSPWTLKLAHGADLSREDTVLLDGIAARTEIVGPREDLIREGDRPTYVHLVVDGYACRYKVLEDGTRQIMAWLLPGDICDLHVAVLGEMDHGIATLTTCRIAYVPVDTVRRLTSHPRIYQALWWNTLTDEATLREWLVNMGRRPADKQIAHLFCELLVRLQAVGRASSDTMDFPVTQAELADTTGMSVVHANRSLQSLRERGLIVLKEKALHVPDTEKLWAFAGFKPAYLHLKNTAALRNYSAHREA